MACWTAGRANSSGATSMGGGLAQSVSQLKPPLSLGVVAAYCPMASRSAPRVGKTLVSLTVIRINPKG